MCMMFISYVSTYYLFEFGSSILGFFYLISGVNSVTLNSKISRIINMEPHF